MHLNLALDRPALYHYKFHLFVIIKHPPPTSYSCINASSQERSVEFKAIQFINPHITIGEYGGWGFNEFGKHKNQYVRERDGAMGDVYEN